MIDLMPGFGAFTPAVVGGASATWNPADKSANITLSGGNLTATSTTSGPNNVRSTAGYSTGKFYSEHTLTISGVSEHSLCLATSATALNVYGGADTTNIAFYMNGEVYYNNALVTTIQATSSGQRVDMAADLTADLVWWRTANGNWNNSGTANPATGTGGIALGVAGTVYVMASMLYGTEVNAAVFASGSWAGSPPAGFGAWV
jgi:hypothetical protein